MNTCSGCKYFKTLEYTSVCLRYPPFSSGGSRYPVVKEETMACGEFARELSYGASTSQEQMNLLGNILVKASARDKKLFKTMARETSLRTKDLYSLNPEFKSFGSIDSVINRTMKIVGAQNRYHLQSMLINLREKPKNNEQNQVNQTD